MKREPDPFPTAFQACLLYIALLLFEVVVASALRDAKGVLALTKSQNSALEVLLGNGCMFAIVMHFRKLTYRRLFHDSESSARATFALVVPPLLLLVPALILFMSAVQDFLAFLFPLSEWEEQFFERVGSFEIATLLAICVLAPVLEEMLFRGIVLRGFLERYSRGAAIFGSAVLFGAVHLNIYQFMVGLVIGLILGWVYERTRSLIPCIALHGAYNTSAVVLTHFERTALGERTFEPSPLAWAVVLLAAAFGVVALRKMLSGPKAVDASAGSEA